MTTMTTINVIGGFTGWLLVTVALYSQMNCGDYVLKRYPLLFLLTGLVFITSNISDGTPGDPTFRLIEVVLYLLVVMTSVYVWVGLYLHENDMRELPFICKVCKDDGDPPLSRGPSG